MSTKNDYWVEIHRAPITGNKPKELYENSKQTIGGTLTRTGAVDTGLSTDEETEFMPAILGASPSDISFRDKVKTYFSQLSISIPVLEPLRLNIGKDDNGKPINIDHYIKYNFIKKDPTVVESEKNANTLGALYYIKDVAKAKKNKYNKNKQEKEAYKLYIQLGEQEEKIDQILRVLGKNIDKMDLEDKDLLLSDLVTSDPDKFIAVCNNRNLELISFIEECVHFNVLKKEGPAVLYHDDILGYNIDEAVLYLQNDDHSSTLSTLKAQLQTLKGDSQSQIRERKKAEKDAKIKAKLAKENTKETKETPTMEVTLDHIDPGADA